MHSQKELVIMNLVEDNIGVIKQAVNRGQVISIRFSDFIDDIEVKEDIPFGFKIAIKDIQPNEKIYKFGEAIGIASRSITRGEMVHVHNVEGFRGRGDLGK